jgi:DNA-binding response OmpR family regulator
MSKASILLVDNNNNYLKTLAKFIEKEGYYVIPAKSLAEARIVFDRGGIDLVIIDVRMTDDNDDKDVSGLILAKETDRSIPKIMLTGFPSAELAQEALKMQLDGLPTAIDFVSKDEDPEVLIWAIRRTILAGATWLKTVKEAISGTDEELKEDYNDAQRQARLNSTTSLIISSLGIVIIFVGIFFVYSKKLEVGIASTLAGIVTETIGYLFFTRVDKANSRMDSYRKERLEGKRFETLLHACDGLENVQTSEQCRTHVIQTVTINWLGKIEEKPNGNNKYE